ncbi:MAG: cytochrome c [Sulfuricurvum sp.]|uniref:c-type cytochrome n=1 Tax=Sulfuricurvum sp. TaxID=2025608 RepID=UPI0025DA6A4A|nr:c-type cytochrome [Sulfuricurvum sp.]MCK9373322.1 cytochrome c [Sulfuricurvum sp.]
MTLIAAAVVSVLLMCGSLQASEDKNIAKGSMLFNANCSGCHTLDGKPREGLDLVIPPRNLTKSLLSREQMHRIIQKGAAHFGASKDIMMAYENILKEDEIGAIALFLSEKVNKKSFLEAQNLYAQTKPLEDEQKANTVRVGRKIYSLRCLFCHGEKGDGKGIATTIPTESLFPYNLNKTLLTKEQKFLVIKYGANRWGAGKDDMGAWHVLYDDTTIKLIVEYIDQTFTNK